MVFWAKQKESNVKQTYNERLLELETELIKIKTKINSLELENETLRDKVLRKIQKRTQPEEEQAVLSLGGSVKGRR